MTEISKKVGGTTVRPAKRTAKRDAYDDFLDGIMPVEKPKAKATESKKGSASSSKKAGSARKHADSKANGRNDRPVKAQAGKMEKASQDKKASGTKKSSTAGSISTSRKRKSPQVEEGIVSLGRLNAASHHASKKPASGAAGNAHTGGRTSAGGRTSRQRPAQSGEEHKAAARNSAKRTTTSIAEGKARAVSRGGPVLALDNPVAGRTPRMPRLAMADGKMDDMFLENEAPEKSRKKSGRKSGPKRPEKSGLHLNGLDIFFSVGIVCILALCVWQGTQYANFQNMLQVVERQSFYPGTTVEGVDVSNMTLSAALDYWRDFMEPQYAERTVTLDNGAAVTAAELGYTSDYETVLSNAWSAGRSGSLEERYEAVTGRQETPVSYQVTRSAYSESALDQYVKAVAEKIDRPAQDAGIESFDAENYTFVFSEAQTGSKLDQEALKQSIRQAMDAGGGTVKMVVNAIQPSQTKADIASQYGMITYAVTNASSSSKSRLNNIKLSLSFINGTCLEPGETFSFNEVVGERTRARGFESATAYSSGEVTEQVGGGICQVSTTLFNAAVKADMEIVERHNHSLTVAYVDKGKDAAVNWGSQDLRFTNTSDDNVYICGYVTDDKRVRIGIFGKLLENGETITVEGVTTGTIKYETEYQASGLLAPGETKVIQSGKNGYTAEAYKIRWDANGNQISRELLCKSRYMSKKEIVQYGP